MITLKLESKLVAARSSWGFTLIEMMIVLMLIGLLLGLAVPRLSRRSPSVQWPNILDTFNALAQFARQESVAHQQLFRLKFARGKNGAPDVVTVERCLQDLDKEGGIDPQPATAAYLNTTYTFPDNIRIKGLFIGKRDQLAQDGVAFCYVVPDGLSQEVYVQLGRTEDAGEQFATFKMLSFAGQFELIEKLVRAGQEGA
jgi:prepilin-type N-terminal cleavage/methylation domain-containing protein